MTSVILLLFVLLGSVSSDRLRFHLENLVDRNVPACANFYRHACSQHVNPEEFFINRVEKIFNDVIAKITPGSDKNSPITFDLLHAGSAPLKLEDNDYENLVRKRCNDDLDCYAEDHSYYASKIWMTAATELPDIPIGSGDSDAEKIQKYIVGTSAIIDELVKSLNGSIAQRMQNDRAVQFHKLLQARIQIIEFMKSDGTYSDFSEIKVMADTMKDRIVKYIEESLWLNRDDVSKRIRKVITERIESVQVYHDFDELDTNTTTLQKINRDLTDFYFSWRRTSGVHGLDVFFGIQEAFKRLSSESSDEISIFIARIMFNFGFGAFYNDAMKSVMMLAQLVYKPVLCSDILKEPLITYHVLGHEMFHSLFNGHNPTLIDLYGHRSKCLADHYLNSCSKFAKGACMSGNQTIYEDGPDVESYRYIYELIHEKYTSEELTAPIDGLDTTREQAFFYYLASGWCEKEEERTDEVANRDGHSAPNMRINAAFSLMPEFTKAFGCKAEDPMYIEEQNSCYFFGPNS